MDELGIGLVVGAAVYGFRHGFDFDHLAALADIAGSTIDKRRARRLAAFYIAGHALVILLLGSAAIAAGAYIPAALDATMGRVIGLTLIGMGGYLAYAAFRYRHNVRFRSRWMLAADGVRALKNRFRHRRVVIEHSHEHDHDGMHDHEHHDAVGAPSTSAVSVTTKHAHVHTHVTADPFGSYAPSTAVVVGMIHGIGAETPSQVLLFAAAAGAGSAMGGAVVLVAFVIGLVFANTVVAVGATAGDAIRERVPKLYFALALVAALFSLALGIAYLFGRDLFFL